MTPIGPFRRLFRLATRSPGELRQEIDDELETHLAMRVEHLRNAGLSEAQAREEALRRFGDVARTRDTLTSRAHKRSTHLRVADLLDSLRFDVIFAFRQMRRARGSAVFAIASLALGIGLATAFFAAVNGILLRPLPFKDAGRLVSLGSVDSAGNAIGLVSSDNFYDWKNQNTSLSGAAMHSLEWRLPIVADQGATRVSGVDVTPEYFDVLGARFIAGRGFQITDASDVVVIAEGMWRRVLGSRPLPINLTVLNRRVTVIGVLARGQEFPAGMELWTLYKFKAIGGRARNNINWIPFGRLAPNSEIERARNDLSRVASGIHAIEPADLYTYGVNVKPLRDSVVGDASQSLLLLMGAVGCVLLIACANLAGINLARGNARARELAVRAAIGANRARLVRQLLVEHVCIALIGGVLGVALAFALLRMLVALASAQLPRMEEVSIDLRVLLFALGVSLAVGLITGLLPALQAGRASLARTMAAVSRGTISGGIAGRALVAAEIAMAVVLMAGAGLLLQSFRTVLLQTLGYETRAVLTADIMLTGEQYRGQPEKMRAYWQKLLEDVRTSTGVKNAGLANWIPMGMGPRSFITIEGRERDVGGGYRVVSDGYFETLQVPLLQGRMFRSNDDATQPRVGIVNHAMAESFWPGESPIGKRLKAPSMEAYGQQVADWITIVGVVGDVRHSGPEDGTAPELYVAYQQLPNRLSTLTMVVRGANSTAQIQPFVMERLRALDPTIAADIGSLSERLDRTLAARRFTMSLLLLFGVLALALAAIGVYSVLAFQVAQRTRELALRTALGANRRRLLELVMASGAKLISIGVVVGMIGAMALAQLMKALVFGITPRDPWVLLAATLAIIISGFLAALIPALRATRVEPMVALQSE